MSRLVRLRFLTAKEKQSLCHAVQGKKADSRGWQETMNWGSAKGEDDWETGGGGGIGSKDRSRPAKPWTAPKQADEIMIQYISGIYSGRKYNQGCLGSNSMQHLLHDLFHFCVSLEKIYISGKGRGLVYTVHRVPRARYVCAASKSVANVP